MLAALLERRPVEDPVALVVAHPDDETLAVGGSLHLFRRLLLVHVTDGAPRALSDAAREGFTTAQAYADARETELRAALARSGVALERASLGIADQAATDSVRAIADHLRALLDAHGVRIVMTHSYEGGHPDHDAVALAACGLDASVFEFPCYHADPSGRFETGFLCQRADAPEVAISLPPADLARKRAMLDCFYTQRDILSRFDPAIERFRPAPRYDFARPPHPGRLLYEAWGWMTGADWLDRVRCSR